MARSRFVERLEAFEKAAPSILGGSRHSLPRRRGWRYTIGMSANDPVVEETQKMGDPRGRATGCSVVDLLRVWSGVISKGLKA